MKIDVTDNNWGVYCKINGDAPVNNGVWKDYVHAGMKLEEAL